MSLCRSARSAASELSTASASTGEEEVQPTVWFHRPLSLRKEVCKQSIKSLNKHKLSRTPSSPSLSILSLGHPALLHHQTVVSPTSPVPHPHILPSLAARSWQLLYSLASSCGHHYPGIVATIRAALHFPHSATLCCVVLICCTKRSLIHCIELGEQTRLDHEIGDSHRRLRLRKQLVYPQCSGYLFRLQFSSHHFP